MDIAKLAHLSKLKISPKEAEEFSAQLGKILSHFQKVSEVNTDGVEPMVTPSTIEMVWRADEVIVETTCEDILKNAPEKSGNLFAVPPVV